MLVCDIDGTILDDRGTLPAPVRHAIRAIAASGVDVVLATGRSPWSGVASICDVLGLDGPQITMQGALLSVPATGEVHRLRTLAPALYRDALRFADELGLDPIVVLLEGHRAERLPEGSEVFTVPIAHDATFRYVGGLERLIGDRPIRVFLPTGPERHRTVRRALANRFAGRASLVWSDATGVEVLPQGTHKGEAIAWLAASRGIALDAVASVGDGANDVEMLWCTGRSAAMGTAPLEARVCADIIVPPASELGVLDAFAWFFPDLADEFDGRGSRGVAGAIGPGAHPAG